MTGRITRFGEADGTAISEITLRNASGLEARIITFGAILRDLVVPTPRGRQRVVLGFEKLADYRAEAGNFGAIVGRHANRIAGARYAYAGETVTLDANEGENHLHGGARHFGRLPWSLVASDEASVTLALDSADGDMGYPGRLSARCTYRLLDPAILRLELEARCDRPCPVNLTTHSYYNLDGSADIRDHSLMIAADHITPVDGALIPTGAIAPVAESPYDFRRERTIGRGVPLDINYVLARERGVGLQQAARLRGASGLALDLWTTEPGLQVYDGHKIAVAAGGLGGARYFSNGGIALEPQRFPDGPNRSYFPPCILMPGEISLQVSEMRFSAT